MKRIVLIDADINLYQISQKSEIDVDWGDGMHTLASDIDRAKEVLDAEIKGIMAKVGATDYLLCISGDSNFRKKNFPTYKANRVSRKPLGYSELKEYAIANHPFKRYDELEADDVIGIMMTKAQKIGEEYVIHSEDKDLYTIAGFIWDKKKQKVILNSPLEADRRLFKQILTGDRVDNYTGLPTCGPVKADKILADCNSPKEMLEATYEAYKKYYKDEVKAKEELLFQARQARILRASDFNFKEKQVILWDPWEEYGNGQENEKVQDQ